jgi:hypothetical protein
MRTLTPALLALAAATLTGCGGDAEGDSPLERVNTMRETAGQLGHMGKAANEYRKAAEEMAQAQKEGVTVDPVDFRQLKEMLPDQVAGIERSDASGEKGGAMGMTMSKATGTYRETEGEARRSVRLTITDFGALQGMAAMGFAWMQVEIDRESDDGYERTSEFEGHPAHEKFTRNGERSDAELQVVVAKRFLVEADGDNVPMEDVKEALKSVDLAKLQEMKDVGVSRQS